MPTAQRSRKPTTSTARSRSRETTLDKVSKAAGSVAGKAYRAVAGRFAPAGPHDAVKMLEKDHRRFEKLTKAGAETTARASKRRVQLLKTLAAELALHERKEEKILYPALKRHQEARDIVLEGYQEHHVADVLVHELGKLDPADERWGAKFKVLKESLEHHIEEEEGKMFKTARSVLGRDNLEELGTRMLAMNRPLKKPTR